MKNKELESFREDFNKAFLALCEEDNFIMLVEKYIKKHPESVIVPDIGRETLVDELIKGTYINDRS